jgi:phage shock protein PspC (stress-responsive transcriptional regulator)
MTMAPSGLLFWDLPITILYAFLISTIGATYTAYLIIIYLIELIILDKSTNYEAPHVIL